MSRRNLDRLWRRRVAIPCGGGKFDATGKGYSFSMVLAEERGLAEQNIDGDPTSALLALSVADPTRKMAKGAMDAGRYYYDNNPDATRYTDNRGIVIDGLDTQDWLADWLNRRFCPNGPGAFTRDWVQYSPHGIKGALSEFIPTVLFNHGLTKLVFPAPSYQVIKSDMNLRGAYPVDVSMEQVKGRWMISTRAIDECLHSKDLSHDNLVVYVNMPHNPTGSGYSKKDWEKLLLWARRHNAILIVDEAYTDLRYNDNTCSVLTVPGWEQSCIVLQSISKGWNATGERFGWIVAHPTMIKAVRTVIDVKDSGMLGSTIASALWCLQHPACAEETRESYERLHRILAEGLHEIGFADAAVPDAGLCQFTRAPRSINGQVFARAKNPAGACAQWMRENLRISTMHATANDDSFIRWAVTLKPTPNCGLVDEESVITEAVRRLKSAEFTF